MKFIIPGRVPSKKNSRKAIYVKGRTIMIPSDDYKDWHAGASWELKAQMKGSAVLKGPRSIEIVFFAPNAVKSDLSNKAESLMDLMVDMQLLKDDNWYEVPELLLRFGGVDRVKPRAEITISPFAILKSKVVGKR